ncbi:MAG: hypothetical protein Q9159_006389 [Coniocarpon cinnabarinum]
MPFSIQIQARRAPHLSPAEFQQYNEEVHLPKMRTWLGDNWPLDHRRFYVRRSSGSSTGTSSPPFHDSPTKNSSGPAYPAQIFRGDQADIDFDVCTVVTFEDEAHFRRYLARMAEPDIARDFREDSGRFVEQQSLRIHGLEDVRVGVNS